MKMRILTSLQLFIVCLLGFSFCVSADVLDPLVDIKPNFSDYNFYGSKDSPNYIAGTYWKNEWVPTPEIGPGTGYLKTTYEPLSLRNNHYYGVNRLLTMTYSAYQQNGYRPSTDVGSVYEGELYGSTSLLQGGYTEISDATVNATSDLVASGGGGSIDISGSAFNGQTELTAMDGGTINVDQLQIADESLMEKYFGGGFGGSNWLKRISNALGYLRVNSMVIIRFLNGGMGFSADRNYFQYDATWAFSENVPSYSGTYYIYSCVPLHRYSFNVVDERLVFTKTLLYCDLYGIFIVVQENFINLSSGLFNLFAQWFYPLKDSQPLYWTFFNTDTNQEESIGLAGLMYNISWYLGQMFQMNSWDLGDTGLQDAADELESTLQEYDKAEQQITDSIDDYISGFIPDTNALSSLVALGWVSQFLQRVFESLGVYSVPLTVAMVLAVCMQFIGYFKYKG